MPPAAAEDRALRAELSEARFALQSQLERLRHPFSGRSGTRGASEIIATLRQQLNDIEAALADLDEGA